MTVQGLKKNKPINIEDGKCFSLSNVVPALIQFLDFIYPIAVKIICSLLMSIAAAYLLLPMAQAERGCDAIGGEWILIIITFLGSLYLFNLIVKVGK